MSDADSTARPADTSQGVPVANPRRTRLHVAGRSGTAPKGRPSA